MTKRKDPADRKPAGRPRIPFDGSDSDKVRLLKMAGTPGVIIAAMMGCTEKTLRNRFPAEMRTEPEHAYALIDATLIELCLDRNLEAIKWLDISRRGMKPTSRQELTGRDGGPIEYGKLSDDEVDARIAAIVGAGGAGETAEQGPARVARPSRGTRSKG